MLSNVFLKTLYEKRWSLLIWTLAMLVTTLLIMLVFPTFKETFGEQLESVPRALRSVLGQAADYQRIEGFIELQVFMQMIFFSVIYGVITFTSLLAGDEGEGTLQTLLAQPVGRSRVYWQKLLAALVMLAIICGGLFLGIALGAALIGEPLSLWRALQGSFMVWAVTLVISMIGYCLGASLGQRGLSGAIAGVFAFGSYIISALAGTVTSLEKINYLSPFKYLMNPRVMDNGLTASNVAIVLGASVVLAIVGWQVFVRRDIYQR